MIKKLFLLSIYFLYTINLAYSQTKPDDPTVSETRQGKFTVSGIVTDSETNEPLIGASVYIKSSHYGGFTGNDGRYKLALQAGNYTLVASYIGYKTVETPIQINVDTNINFNLKLSENEIEEVKITKQRNFWRNLNVGRNISSLNAKRIEHLNTNNAADILQATMPGVWSTQTSGAPGDHQNVKIRGINSIFGCTDPLYIIDGVAVPIVNLHSLGIADLNVHDIENITVLKDASSTAVYGFQGGNGVIIIDTKRSDNNAINFSYKLGVQQLPKQLSLLDSKGFLTNIDSAYNNGVNQIYKYYPTYTDTVKNTNWQDALFQYGVLNEYQLAGSGKIGKTYFYISGNFYSHEGIVEKTGFKRYTAAANIGRNVNERFSIEVGIRSSFQENNNNLDVYNGNDVIIESINKSPLLKSTPDSFYYWPRNDMKPYNLVLRNYYKYPLISDYPESKIFTDSVLKSNLNTLNTKTNSFDLRAKYKIADNLYVNASSSISSRTNNYISDIRIGVNENYFKTNENYLLFNQQFNINYNKTFTDHNLQLTCGYRNYADNAYWGLDSISDINNTHNSFLKNSLAINGKHGAVIRYINSWSVIANYDFKNKYYLSFIANKESLKVDNDKTLQSVFPSLTVSWDIARERFMEHLPFINEFKLFSNWGKVGNMPINVLAKDVYSNYRYNYFDTIIYSRGISQFSNHNLKPEIIEEYNTGINLACFNNKVKLMADYYFKTSTNLIAIRDIPFYYGGGRMIYNMGQIANQGKEFSIDIDLYSGDRFSLSTNFTISTNYLRVKKISAVSELSFYNSDILVPDFEVKENQELSVIKGYKYIGKWSDSDTKENNPMYFNSMGGKYLKTDTINKKKLTRNDMQVIGKSLPDFTWHWSHSIQYGNFSVELLWYGVHGINKFNGTTASTYMAGTNSGTKEFLNKGNRTLLDSIFYESSFFVEDASFIRLKQLTISYSVPKKLFGLKDLKFSLSFENLLTLTKYTGYDPEATIYTDNSFSDNAVDRGAYPIPRAVYFTLNASF